jgi:hypothetical protein
VSRSAVKSQRYQWLRGFGEGQAEWGVEIDKHLEASNVILLLVSADFLASDYCYEKEMGRAMERHAQGAACVIPIILRSCDWQSAPFGKLQALPKDGKAITSWGNRDEAFTNVVEGLKRAIVSLGEPAHLRKTAPPKRNDTFFRLRSNSWRGVSNL